MVKRNNRYTTIMNLGKTNNLLSKKYLYLALGLMVLVTLTAAGCRRGPALDTETDQNTDQQTTDETQTPSGFDINNPDLGQGQSGVGTPPVAGLGLPDATASKTVLDAELTKATDSVRLLANDAVLKLVSMKFINSFSDTAGLSTNYYIFASPANPQYYYLVNVPRNGEKMKRFIMPVEDLELPFDLLDLPFRFWKLSYIEAIKAAEAIGAKDFTDAHKQFDLSIILGQPAGQYLNWFLTYKATDGSGATLKIAVDSYSGKASIVR